jgi:hypothetical protein
MGLTVMLIGSDPDDYDLHTRSMVRIMLDEIGRQVQVDMPFQLGSVNQIEAVSEKLGSYGELHLLRKYAAHVEQTGRAPRPPLSGSIPGLGVREAGVRRRKAKRFRHSSITQIMGGTISQWIFQNLYC